MPAAQIHPTSVVADDAFVGEGTQVWLFCQIRERARIGRGCTVGKGVYIDADVVVGDRVKIQNNVSLFTGTTLEDGVFVGPHVCFTNDRVPRAVNPDLSLKRREDWTVTKTRVKVGASIGASATVLCGVTVGRWAMVGAASVVTHDVPDHALVVGHPARLLGWVCACGRRVDLGEDAAAACRCGCGRRLARAEGVVHVE
jgi:acetyltransferase-like isoleucine patch superfamily enzyme